MIQMLYDYYSKYTTKHSVACNDVYINSTSKSLLSFNLLIVYYILWPNGNGSDFEIQGSCV